MNPRAPSWSPGKRRWTAGTLGEKSRKEAAAAAANLEHRLEREAESSNERTNTAKSAKSEFDRLLKRFVHIDPTARRTARRRFAKQMLQGQDAQSDGKNTMYTLYFPKAKEAAVQTDDRETSSEKVVISSASRKKSWADEVEEEEEEKEEEEEEKAEEKATGNVRKDAARTYSRATEQNVIAVTSRKSSRSPVGGKKFGKKVVVEKRAADERENVASNTLNSPTDSRGSDGSDGEWIVASRRRKKPSKRRNAGDRAGKNSSMPRRGRESTRRRGNNKG